jgi:UDP-glucose 4-epimerase
LHPILQENRAGATFVTGATGFVGAALVRALMAAEAPVRQGMSPRHAGGEGTSVRYSLHMSESELAPLLSGCDRVVHLAALVHESGEAAAPEEFRLANVAATEHLARAAARAGVRRFVLMSTAKVFGESSPAGRAFDENDAPRPADAYAESKWQAEQALAGVARATGIEHVVLRPPLVFGPGVRANFLRLLDAVARGTPLPIGRVNNARSLSGIGNLVSAIVHCLVDPRAAGQTFVVSDPVPISTPDLVREIAAAFEMRARLPSVPVPVLLAAARAAGKADAASKLVGSFVVNASRIATTLDWSPPDPRVVTLARTVAWYRETHGGPPARSG